MKLRLQIPQLINKLVAAHIKAPDKKLSGDAPTNRSEPPNATQLLLDTEAVLNILLQEYRYEPLDVLQLLSKCYGRILSSCPDYVGFDVAGTPITPEYIESEFISQCKQEVARQKSILKNVRDKARMN